MQRFLKNIWTLSCWYSLESSCWVLSDEYPFARVSVIFQVSASFFVLAKLATSSVRVNTKVCYPFLWCLETVLNCLTYKSLFVNNNQVCPVLNDSSTELQIMFQCYNTKGPGSWVSNKYLSLRKWWVLLHFQMQAYGPQKFRWKLPLTTCWSEVLVR